jgi:hypothetical protein
MSHHHLSRAQTPFLARLLVCLASLAGCTRSPDISRPEGTGAGTVLTFTNGGTPAPQQSGTTEELNSVTFGGSLSRQSLFVAVGAAGAIVTSTDGVSWQDQTSPTPLSLYGIAFGNDQFVAVGGNEVAGAGVILSGAPSGLAWTLEPESNNLSESLTGITYANGQFVAVGNNQVLTSADGNNWSALPTEPSGITAPTVDLYSTAYGSNLFVTVGTYNTTTSSQEIAYDGFIATSPDANTWTILPYTSNYLSGVTYGTGQFVAVGREGSILTSSDGSIWTAQSAPQLDASKTPYLISVIYAGNQFVATGNYVGTNPSTGFLLTSPDGVTWTLQTTGPNLYDIAYGVVGGVGTYVAVGGE